MAYKFYIQKYPQGTQTFAKVNLEATYNCTYKQFKDIVFNGDIKNTYTESFAERDGDDVYIPEVKDLCFKSYECKLELLFDKSTCQADVQRFYEDIRGQRIEYSDTFRNRYVTLLLTKQPKIDQEILYGNRTYMLVSFTFSNIVGRSFLSSQIK